MFSTRRFADDIGKVTVLCLTNYIQNGIALQTKYRVPAATLNMLSSSASKLPMSTIVAMIHSRRFTRNSNAG